MGALGRLAASVKGSISRGSGRPASNDRRDDDDHATTGGIDVSYAPDLDGDPDPGEVVWAWVPFEDDPTQGKDRPVLVVGHDGLLLAAVQLSSKDHSQRQDHGDWVEIGRGSWDREGRVSYVDAERLLRFEPSAMRREGAILDRERFDAVLARVTTLHGWRP